MEPQPLSPQPDQLQSLTPMPIVLMSLIVDLSTYQEDKDLTVSTKFPDKLLPFGTPSIIKTLETLQAELAKLTLTDKDGIN
jgi:ligand-binding SRPBCC domain-containing protein